MTLPTLIERLFEPLPHDLTDPNMTQHSQQPYSHQYMPSLTMLGMLTEELLEIPVHHLVAS